jgi:hypothetical protein
MCRTVEYLSPKRGPTSTTMMHKTVLMINFVFSAIYFEVIIVILIYLCIFFLLCAQYNILLLFVPDDVKETVCRGQRERGSGGGSPLVRGSAQFGNE